MSTLTPRIIVLTMYTRIEDIERAIDAGASTYRRRGYTSRISPRGSVPATALKR